MENGIIRVGLVGAGANTRLRHITGLREQEGVEIVGVANRSRESGERIAAEFEIPIVYDSWLDLIQADDIDAIVGRINGDGLGSGTAWQGKGADHSVGCAVDPAHQQVAWIGDVENVVVGIDGHQSGRRSWYRRDDGIGIAVADLQVAATGV